MQDVHVCYVEDKQNTSKVPEASFSQDLLNELDYQVDSYNQTQSPISAAGLPSRPLHGKVENWEINQGGVECQASRSGGLDH